MKYAIIIARVLPRVIFVVLVATRFCILIPMPPLQRDAGAFLGAPINSGYVYAIGLATGIGRFMPAHWSFDSTWTDVAVSSYR